MVIPGSMDFGSINIKTTFKSRKYTVKIYPKLVHVIKSINSSIPNQSLKSLQGMRGRLRIARSMVDKLEGLDQDKLGGFRIEVSTTAPTLSRAIKWVSATPFLRPSYWLGNGPGPHYPHLLMAKLVTKQGLINNAKWIHQQAVGAGIFRGNSSKKPGWKHQQVITDIYNGFGWSLGHQSTTRSLSDKAWWIIPLEQDFTIHPLPEDATIQQRLAAVYNTDQDIGRLYFQARAYCLTGVPCKAHPEDPEHAYHVNQRHNFRVRCKVPECHNSVRGGSLVQWIADLVANGVINGEVLGISV
jgi:hypothetical protein